VVVTVYAYQSVRYPDIQDCILDFIAGTYISFELLFKATTSIEPAPKPLLASTMSVPTDETQQKTPSPLFTVYKIPY